MPYDKVVDLIEKVTLAYFVFPDMNSDLKTDFNMKIFNFRLFYTSTYFCNLKMDLGVLAHGEQLCLLDILSEMPVFCSLQRNLRYNEIY